MRYPAEILAVVFLVATTVSGCKSQPAPSRETQPPEETAEPVPQLDREAIPVFVRIPAGTFTMGSPADEPHRTDDEQQHSVTLTRDFNLQAHEVTQGEWQQLMDENPSRFDSCGEYCPVESVSWYAALVFANALSRAESRPECYTLSGCRNEPGEARFICAEVSFVGLDCPGYRLPTEAEWEYAARAGTTELRYGDLNEVAYHEHNSGHRTRPVGEKMPNDWGLYDMLGNVWEWTWDGYAAFSDEPVIDPLGDESSETRVLRGGGWNFPGRNVRAAHRNHLSPVIRGRNGSLGVRLARTASGDEAQ